MGRDEAGLVPRSVRLRTDSATTLVKADGGDALSEAMAGIQGDVVGVTLSSDGGLLSVLGDGSVIFEHDVDPMSVVVLMATVARRHRSWL